MLATAIMCLALNVFHEARGEPLEGQIAVAQVTLRRANNEPRRVCKAVYAPKQFSWTEEKQAQPTGVAWDNAKLVASLTLANRIPDVTNGATHFHCYKVHPQWKGYRRTVKIGSHIFYKPVKNK